MEQNLQPQQVNAKKHNPILTIVSSVLITAVFVGFGMYFLSLKLIRTTNSPAQDASTSKGKGENSKPLNNTYMLSSKITSGDGSPLETLSLFF